MSEISPGWYKDPVDASVQRYWDGEGWLGDPIPADAPAPSGPPRDAKPPVAFTKPVKAPAVGGDPGDAPLEGITALPVPRGVPLPPNAPVPVALPPGMPLPPGTIQLPPDAVPPGTLPPGAIPVLLPPGLRFAALPPIARPQVRPHGHALAPLGSRVVARLVDMALVLVLNVAVNGWFVYRFWQKFYPAYRQAAAGSATANDSATAGFQSLMVVVLVLAAALWFAYEVPATANSGQTVGKRLMRIKVMALDNPAPLGFGRAIRRWNPLGLPTLLWPCGVGFVLQFLDSLSPLVDWPLHRAFHDRSAGTVVIRVEAAPDRDSDSAPRTHADAESDS